MTESEASERIKKDICNGNPNCICRDACMYGKGKCAYDMAVRALEEVQQYRAIGTVSEFRELKEKAIKKVEKCKNKHYCECGCPVEIMLDGITLKPIGGQIYCDQCGAKLDWSEFVEKGE